MTPSHWWVRQIFWIDGLGALAAGLVVLGFRRFFAGLYELPLALVTALGIVNLSYAALALTLALRKQRRRPWIASLSMANYSWALICVLLLVRFSGDASIFGVLHFVIEGAWVAFLGTVEWRNRDALSGTGR